MRYVTEIATALEYVHARGIVHCDLKLSNIFANKEGDDIHLKIADFGLALSLDVSTHKAFMPLKAGTFNYLAPEVGNVIYVRHPS